MKKITLLAMSLFTALFVNAQEDATDLLTNASFDAQTSKEQTPVTGWEGEFQTQTASYPNFTGTFAEKWCGSYVPGTGETLTEGDITYYKLSDFACSQTIEVENGVYVLGAYVIANNQQLASLNPVEGVLLCANEDATSCASANGVPEWHQVTTVVEDGKLTVALRTSSTTANWVAWDGITLTRYTGATVEEAKLAWIKDELVKAAEEADELLSNTIYKSIADELNAKINAIADVATYADGDALLTEIKGLIKEGKASQEAYALLFATIEAANAELDRGFTEGVDEFMTAINAAEDLYNGATGDNAAVEAAIIKLEEDVFTFQMLNADGTERFDVTNKYMTNPTLRKGSEGWSGSKPGLEHEVMEFYQSDFDIYQELTNVPNGMYVVSVQGFYRKTWNDSGEAYNAGTETISALLYANNAASPLLSIYKYPVSVMGVTSDQVLNDYVNMRVSASEAFGLTNEELGIPYYAENEVTVLVSDGTLRLGLRNEGHEAGSWCTFRDFKLYYYGNFPGVVLAGNIEAAEAWLDENLDVLPEAAVSQLQDAMMEAEDYTDAGLDEVEVQAAIAAFDATFKSVQNVVTLFDELTAKLLQVESLIELEYPGLDKLVAAYETADAIATAGSSLEIPEGQTAEAYMQEAVAALEEAIVAYYQSQEATRETPANYTYLIPNPNFEQKGDWTWSMVAGGTDQWIGGCRPNEEGGANRQGVNLWGWGISSIDVHQELTNLPNGLYKVSAELITQAGYATDQHVYAKGLSTVTSEPLTEEGWDSYVWQELTTTECAVVIDGKLTIGAASSEGGSNSEAWFQATNFKLLYCGEATSEDLKAAWESSLQRANEMVDILLPGDSKAVKDAIAVATPLAEAGQYSEACQALNPAVIASDSIFNAVQNFYNGNYQAVIDLAGSLDYEVNTESARVLASVMQMAGRELAAEDATHKILDPLDAKLGGYVAYATYLIEAENILATIKGVSAENITRVKNYITLQVDDLVAELRTAADCEDLLAKLKKNILALESYDKLNLQEGDLTEDLIANPTIEDEQATGWTILLGTGNQPTNKGQHYDGTPENRYLDSWNGTVGKLNFTAYQEIVGLPDGTYQLTVATRADGENAYVFASPEALEQDTAKWAAAAQWAEVKKYYADHGEIWFADSLAWVASGGTIEAPYFNANNGRGLGWSYDTVNVVVTNHYLAIGITSNSQLTCKERFTGTWFGADDWKLVLVEKAATQSEHDPFSGIESLEVVAPTMKGIYDLFGRRVETPAVSGIYIIDGRKVVIKK